MGKICLVLLSIAAATALPAAAQPYRTAPRAAHALNPTLSGMPPAATPLEAQIRQNYRTQLLEAQRELAQGNPSGLGRAQIAIGREIDNFNNSPPR